MSFTHPRLLNRGVALVTSAAKGAGRAIALRLASEGFKVAVHDLPHNGELLLNVHRNIQRLGQHSVVLAADITEEDQVKSLVEDTYKCLGGLDVMVANTAVRESAPLISTTAEAWNRLFDVNARGVFFCYKYAAQQMISEGKGGRIIGGCSAWGKKGLLTIISQSAYSASHFAVRGLTESAALELHEHGITVNSYAPGWIPLLFQVFPLLMMTSNIHCRPNHPTYRYYQLIGSIPSASTIRNGKPRLICSVRHE
ncbi:NAD(P)-binding protein [Lentinula guzmanii]|uniref:NAD(P)-binding protein n=1 Tax=Lentinula guzmanii TaxID=2804957 RepID=A0AA38J4E0_9AGAR|nr:NAD(P)-binding protein [Lentinula guzmanii]